ncbi:hypothetical protein ACFVH6_21910 [Spirillospora sp. NPDC127200]
MATLATTIPPVLNATYTGSTNQGQAAGWTAAGASGDLIPLTGQGTILRVRTEGTACTVTIDSVAASSYGQDQNITLVLAATDEQEVIIKNDGRFDQGGENKGRVSVSYSATTNVSVAAKVIPGSL